MTGSQPGQHSRWPRSADSPCDGDDCGSSVGTPHARVAEGGQSLNSIVCNVLSTLLLLVF